MKKDFLILPILLTSTLFPLQTQTTLAHEDASLIVSLQGEPAKPGDLKSGDPVTVRFDQNAQPEPRAFNLTVTE